jgi:hypothetical protein
MRKTKRTKIENAGWPVPLECLVMYFPVYVPYKGFYDLRCYDIPKKIFKKLWRIQKFLFKMEQKKAYYKKWHPTQWEAAKELSANYQQVLFQYT